MNISILGCCLALILAVIPLFFIYVFSLQRLQSLLRSFGLMTGMVLLSGLAVMGLMRWDNIWVTILSGAVMTLFSTLMIVRRSRLRIPRLIWPTLAGVFASSWVIGLYVLLLLFGFQNAIRVQYFIPVFGLLLGGMIGSNSYALHIYYMGLHHHHQLYTYLLGNGATHREAVSYFVRRSFQAAFHPVMRQMSGVGIASAPVVMLSLIMAGMDVWTAIMIQILYFVTILSATLVSLYISLVVGRRYLFDAYERLRPVPVQASPAPVAPFSPTPAPASDSSASPSAHPHTDAESLPEE